MVIIPFKPKKNMNIYYIKKKHLIAHKPIGICANKV